MKFYMTPGSCSTGIHILLEELELIFEVYLVNLMAGDHLKPENLAVNPKATIPTLVRDNGSSITEFQAIAWWLARTYPKAKLLPEDIDDEVRVIELSLLPAVRAADADTLLIANGTSCRHQIRDGAARESNHLAQVLQRALRPEPKN